mmetsp:Transcript_125904/g.251213  ORF Transcript_125904/g.251213 Transcript_125904/m.251213 type:complete len:211 (-) Transcript_125904:5-637(-)
MASPPLQCKSCHPSGHGPDNKQANAQWNSMAKWRTCQSVYAVLFRKNWQNTEDLISDDLLGFLPFLGALLGLLTFGPLLGLQLLPLQLLDYCRGQLLKGESGSVASHWRALLGLVAGVCVVNTSQVPEQSFWPNRHVEHVVHLCVLRQDERTPDALFEFKGDDINANAVSQVLSHVRCHVVACVSFGTPVFLVIRNFTLIKVHITFFAVP